MRHLRKQKEEYKQNVANFVAAYLGENLDKIGYNYDDIIRISSAYSHGLRNRGGRVELTLTQTQSLVSLSDQYAQRSLTRTSRLVVNTPHGSHSLRKTSKSSR